MQLGYPSCRRQNSHRRCQRIQQETLGDDHPHPPDTKAELAWLLCERGRPGDLEEATHLLREAFASQKRIDGPNHRRTLVTAERLEACPAAANLAPP